MFLEFSEIKKFKTIADFDQYKSKLYDAKSEELQKDMNDKKNVSPYALKKYSELSDDEKSQMCRSYYTNKLYNICLAMAFQKGDEKNLKTMEKEFSRKSQQKYFSEEESRNIHKEYQEDHLRNLKQWKSELNTYLNNIRITIKRSELNKENLILLKEFCEALLDKGEQISIYVHDKQQQNDDSIDYLYSNQQINQIIELNNHLLNKGMQNQIRFFENHLIYSEIDLYSSWTLDDVVNANKNIDSVVDHIKQNNYSPYEAMTYIHMYVTKNFEYNDGTLEACRSIVGAYKGTIVCAGYATLVKAIIDKLNDPNLQCDILGCNFYKKQLFGYKNTGAHSHNLIHINDEKYGIKGHYMEDTCWDAKNDYYPDGKGFAYFMYPVSDLEYFNGLFYQQQFSDYLYDNIFFDTRVFDKGFENKRDKFKPKTPEVIERYAQESKAIPLDTLEQAVFTVYQSVEKDKSLTEQKIEEKMKSSTEIAKRSFTNKAQSCLVTNSKYKIRRKNKKPISLAENDGRLI